MNFTISAINPQSGGERGRFAAARVQNACTERPLKSNKRDTRKWCRGKFGTPHVCEWKNYYELHHGEGSAPDFRWEQEVCVNCGRRLRLRDLNKQ